MKIKRLRISTHLLVDFLREPIPPGITAEGLPGDARIVHCEYEQSGVVVLFIESESFESVPALTDAPEFVVLFHKEHAR